MAFLPFSQKAKVWEPIATQLRKLSGVRNGDVIDPVDLADRVGLCLVDANDALEGFPQEDRDHLLVTVSDAWSGGVFPVPAGWQVRLHHQSQSSTPAEQNHPDGGNRPHPSKAQAFRPA